MNQAEARISYALSDLSAPIVSEFGALKYRAFWPDKPSLEGEALHLIWIGTAARSPGTP
jgi:hypothetical protein